jgi:hypothetical protein
MEIPDYRYKQLSGAKGKPLAKSKLSPARNPEQVRMDEDTARRGNWRRWGPYLSERQWGTVREDYSADGNTWSSFLHDQARSKAYRWGEDGLLGICDRQCRLCFALALWNGRDPILKERLFGLTGNEGNHGEDVKECYFYLDALPTSSYLKALYKYPQTPFPYDRLVEENRRRGRNDPEFELLDCGVFDANRYFDVFVEYAKAGPEDILIRITAANRGPEAAPLHLLPTLWFRNTWVWGRQGEDYSARPRLKRVAAGQISAEHETLGNYLFCVESSPDGGPELLFTENETNTERLYGLANAQPYVKDAFHRYLIEGQREAVNPAANGTRMAAYYRFVVPAGGECTVQLRLTEASGAGGQAFGAEFDRIAAQRLSECEQFYQDLRKSIERIYLEGAPAGAGVPTQQAPWDSEQLLMMRQALAGMYWTTQFYHLDGKEWLEGDPAYPPPPPEHAKTRNGDWQHLHCKNLILMPDKWEYPYFCSWDLAFHALALASVDPDFSKRQVELVLHDNYMHPNGQIPAYEFNFSDVNPPVQAWAAFRIYKTEGLVKGVADRVFLARLFQRLLLNFSWWVNRKDPEGRNIFGGGFLGLDNIGVFDRSRPSPTGGRLEQADATAWMAFYCASMLDIALELAYHDRAYEDIAYKFFEHFSAIVDAINTLGGTGLWNDEDGFYYDQVDIDGRPVPLRSRSMVGLIPVLAAAVVDSSMLNKMPDLFKRVSWFMRHRPNLARHLTFAQSKDGAPMALLALPPAHRLVRVLRYVLDEAEFLSPYGIRSLSRYHAEHPIVFAAGGGEHRVVYTPGESDSGMFGGNSNWRGPVWFPINYLLIEALEAYNVFYGEQLKVECPTGSGRMMNLAEVAREIATRVSRLFIPDATGQRSCHGTERRFARDPHWKDLVLFHEYFHGDTGRGLGASHQTGWTGLVLRCARRAAMRFHRFNYQPGPSVRLS